jgi:hypothetical protein
MVLLLFSIAQNARANETTKALRQLDNSFRNLDINKDGRLDRREASREEGLDALFARADLDRDYSLTAFEYELLHLQPEDETAFVRR